LSLSHSKSTSSSLCVVFMALVYPCVCMSSIQVIFKCAARRRRAKVISMRGIIHEGIKTRLNCYSRGE
jgi:hypothetical protein